MSSNSRVVTNTFSQVASRVLVILVSLLTTALLTRLFGSEGYGNYVFITSFILMFVGLSELGTTTIAVRNSSAHPQKREKIFSLVLGLRSILSLCLVFLLNFLILSLPQFSSLRPPALIASTVVVFLVLRSTFQAVFQSFLRLDVSALLEFLAALFFVVPIVFFWSLGKPLPLSYLMVFWASSALFSGLIGWIISLKYLSVKPDFDKKEIFTLLKEAYPLGIYLLVYSIYDRGVDSFIIKTFIDSSAVGFYGLAYKIHGNLILGAAFLMNSLFPILSTFKSNSSALKQTFQKTFAFLFLSGALISFVFFLFAPQVINLISGPSFTPSVLALRILMGATFFSYLNHLTGYLMVVLGEQKKLLSFSLFALMINLVLNIIFIPLFSFYAAAAITILTELTLFVLTKKYLTGKYNLKINAAIMAKNFQLLLIKKQKYFENFDTEENL